MLLAIDVGNTNITLAAVQNGEPSWAESGPTASASSPHGLAGLLDDLLTRHGADLNEIHEAVVASVVPGVTAAIEQLFTAHGIGLLVADANTVPLPMHVPRPGDVGADRLVNAFAGLRLYGAPLIVVDVGTATTFDVVDESRAFVGGAIAPGIALGAEALASRTALLPKVELALPQHAIGTDTVGAMQSGIVIGYIGLVRELVATITAELAGNRGTRPTVILTGGFSKADWADEIRADIVDPELTLRGLAILHAEVTSAAAQATTA